MKRRILLKSALAGASLFTIASCGNSSDSGAPPPAGGPPPSGSPPPGSPPPPPPGSPPPPNPAPTGARAFRLLSAASQSAAPFSIGFAFRQGEIPAGMSVAADRPNVQAIVKNRWPDGSAKFAVVSGRAALVGGTWLTVTLAPGAAAGGANLTEADLLATGITASLQFSPFGTVALAPLIGVPSTYNATARRWTAGRAREWISGPEMSSWLYYAPIGADAHLAAWFEVRLWRDGHVEVLPWIENGYLNVAGPTAKSGTASFTLGARERFNASLALTHRQRAVLVTGNVLSHWLSTDPQVTLSHDRAYLESTRLVPTYFGAAGATGALYSRLPTTHTPLAQGAYYVYMPAGGYHEEIGLIPEWDAAYLTTNCDPRAFAAVQIQGYLAGRFGTHYRDETTNQPLRFSQYPNLVANQSGNSALLNIGASTTNSYTPTPTGAAPPWYDPAHHPSMGFMAYLLSGRYFFVEETQFIAAVNFLMEGNGSDRRNGTQGIMSTSSDTLTMRGAAWALRSLWQATTVTPDDDAALRGEFIASCEANIDRYHTRYVATNRNPYGICTPHGGGDYTAGDGKYMHSWWMDDFFTMAWGYARFMGLPISTAHQSRLEAFFSWKARFAVGRLGRDGVASEFSFRRAAQYTGSVAPTDNPNWSTGTGPWYNNFGEIYQATFNTANSAAPLNTLVDSFFPDPTSYWGNFLPAIVYAVDHGAAGALDAWNRLTAASNWSQLRNGFNTDPVWGVRPRSV